jgi:hypothetical protein
MIKKVLNRPRVPDHKACDSRRHTQEARVVFSLVQCLLIAADSGPDRERYGDRNSDYECKQVGRFQRPSIARSVKGSVCPLSFRLRGLYLLGYAR